MSACFARDAVNNRRKKVVRVHVDTACQEVDNDFVVWYKHTEDKSLKGQGDCVQSNIIQTPRMIPAQRATRNPVWSYLTPTVLEGIC